MADTEKCSNDSSGLSCCGPQTDIPKLSDRPCIPLPEPIPDAPWITGAIETPVGKVPVVATKLQRADILGSWKVRWGIGRMSYRVQPRLYAVGSPTNASPVFVTANYKMSFDRLRSNLDGIDGWILVLDTKGINVWCAAGKGTFGSAELIRRIGITRLAEVVSHRRLIVPQLGATGVSAHKVKEGCGFHVFYGPIRASDIPSYMNAHMKATPEMRRVTFTLKERSILIPVDMVGNLKHALLIAAGLLVLSGLGTDIYSLNRVGQYGVLDAALIILAALCGAVLPALLLPWLPGRTFSVKGAIAGIIPVIAIALLGWSHPEFFRNRLSAVAWLLMIPAVTSFIAMNFTGSSTYTSLSGVKKEMRVALPVQIGGAAGGLVLWMIGLFI